MHRVRWCSLARRRNRRASDGCTPIRSRHRLARGVGAVPVAVRCDGRTTQGWLWLVAGRRRCGLRQNKSTYSFKAAGVCKLQQPA